MSIIVKPKNETVKSIIVDRFLAFPYRDPFDRHVYADCEKLGRIVELKVDPNRYYEVFDEYYDSDRDSYGMCNFYEVARSVTGCPRIWVFEEWRGLLAANQFEKVFETEKNAQVIFAKASLRDLLKLDNPTFFGTIEVDFHKMNCFNHSFNSEDCTLNKYTFEYRGSDIAICRYYTIEEQFTIIVKLTDVHSLEEFNAKIRQYHRNFDISNEFIQNDESGSLESHRAKIMGKYVMNHLIPEALNEINTFIGTLNNVPEKGKPVEVSILSSVDDSDEYVFHESTIIPKQCFELVDGIYFLVTAQAEYFIELKK